MQDAGAGYNTKTFAQNELLLFERALKEGKLTIRTSIALFMTESDFEETLAEIKRLRRLHSGDLLRFGAVKTYVDGVIESKTAAMLEPYAESDELGHLNWSPEALKKAVVAADRDGVQVILHAIGDRGVRTALDAFEAVVRENGPKDRRGRIEHIETIHPDDYPRFAELGVIASMMPLHAEPNDNMLDVWAKNVGPERIQWAFGWRGIERAGARLVFGSDWSVVTPDVMAGLYVSVTRRTRRGAPPGGWMPAEAIRLENALRHYTIDGAYASFDEDKRGSIEVGKYADLAVLSPDLLEGPPENLLKTQVKMTLMGGQIVYSAEEYR